MDTPSPMSKKDIEDRVRNDLFEVENLLHHVQDVDADDIVMMVSASREVWEEAADAATLSDGTATHSANLRVQEAIDAFLDEVLPPVVEALSEDGIEVEWVRFYPDRSQVEGEVMMHRVLRDAEKSG